MSFQLKLTGFRHYGEENEEISFPDGNLILLRGKSGIGKSTLFQAILWCLYGTIRNVYNHDIDKTKVKNRKCSVSIIFSDDFFLTQPSIKTITRAKNPERIDVVFPDGSIQQGAVANASIEKVFGGQDVWLSTSYLTQGCRSLIMTASNTDKMNILRQLAFSGDLESNERGPTRILARCDTKIAELSRLVNQLQMEVTFEFEQYKKDYSAQLPCGFLPEFYVPQGAGGMKVENLSEIKNREQLLHLMQTLITKIQHLQREVEINNQNINLRYSLGEMAGKVKGELEIINSHLTVEVDVPEVEKEIQQLMVMAANYRHHVEMMDKYSKINNELQSVEGEIMEWERGREGKVNKEKDKEKIRRRNKGRETGRGK